MATVCAPKAAQRATGRAAQLLGGAGFVEPGAVARYWRQG